MFVEEDGCGDIVISASCSTEDDTTAVRIYEFTPDREGTYTLDATVYVWQMGGPTLRWYVQGAWAMRNGILRTAGALFVSGKPAAPAHSIKIDSALGKGRVLVTGLANVPLRWGIQGILFDLSELPPDSKRPAFASGAPPPL